jgi:hypothetical protein
MSLAELKTEISRSTPEERLELAAFLTHLNRTSDDSWLIELDTRLLQMESGKKSNQEELENLNRQLSAMGR